MAGFFEALAGSTPRPDPLPGGERVQGSRET